MGAFGLLHGNMCVPHQRIGAGLGAAPVLLEMIAAGKVSRALRAFLGAIGDSIKQEGADKQLQTDTLIRADERLNAVVIHAKPEMLQVLTDIVRQLDIPRSQVLVEAAIVEISGDIEDALGVQWALDGGSRNNGVGGVNFNNTGLSIGTLLTLFMVPAMYMFIGATHQQDVVRPQALQ